MKSLKQTFAVACLSVAVVLTAAFIFSRSAKPPADSKAESDGVYDRVSALFGTSEQGTVITRALFRKMAHFAEFFLLGAELALLFLCMKRRFSLLPFLTLLCALTDETVQLFSGRVASVADVWLDFAGSLTGICFVWLASKLWKNWREYGKIEGEKPVFFCEKCRNSSEK